MAGKIVNGLWYETLCSPTMSDNDLDTVLDQAIRTGLYHLAGLALDAVAGQPREAAAWVRWLEANRLGERTTRWLAARLTRTACAQAFARKLDTLNEPELEDATETLWRHPGAAEAVFDHADRRARQAIISGGGQGAWLSVDMLNWAAATWPDPTDAPTAVHDAVAGRPTPHQLPGPWALASVLHPANTNLHATKAQLHLQLLCGHIDDNDLATMERQLETAPSGAPQLTTLALIRRRRHGRWLAPDADAGETARAVSRGEIVPWLLDRIDTADAGEALDLWDAFEHYGLASHDITETLVGRHAAALITSLPVQSAQFSRAARHRHATASLIDYLRAELADISEASALIDHWHGTAETLVDTVKTIRSNTPNAARKPGGGGQPTEARDTI